MAADMRRCGHRSVGKTDETLCLAVLVNFRNTLVCRLFCRVAVSQPAFI